MNRRVSKAIQYALAIGGGALIVTGGNALFDHQTQAKDRAKIVPIRLETDTTPLQRDGKQLTSFADVVKRVSPSVVKVYTTTKAKPLGGESHPFFDDPLFRRFFGERFEQMPRGQAPRQQGLGSGVIVTKDGYILTNNHVVDNADEVKVALSDGGDEFTAKVVGADPKTDIAVLKVDLKGKSLPYLVAGDSDQIQVGDVVLAVGNPFGIGQTVTMGIVSATGRASLGMDYEDFIQTDAAINPGNSGGALVDAQGRLIGINTAILSRTGGNHGIGFAVPINLARNVMEGLIEHGRVIRGFMGVNIQDVTPALAEEFGLKDANGALVADITEGSPADKAGLKSGDVIVEFNGKAVRDARSLKLQVAQTAPGQEVPLKVARDGKAKELEVTLKEFPKDKLASSSHRSESESTGVLEGVALTDLDAAARQQFNIPSQVKGALVQDVDAESAAFRAGLRPGDVIQEINRQAIHDADQAATLAEKGKTNTLLRVWSRVGSRFILLKNDNLG